MIAVRFVPMDEEQFRESLERSIVRYASDMTRRGLWTEAAALETSRAEFAQLLPEGRQTLNHRFRTIVDAETGTRVGETWCTVRRHGGKLQYWIDWLLIEQAHRRRGFGRAALHALTEEALAEGAERVGLYVISDNAPARTLYEDVGFQEDGRRMILRLG